jgi:hypothetical protein
MRRKRKRAAELRQAIDCLPDRTRRAMLEGIDQNQIIVGAYTDNNGGVCPMLAAHRNGGRTDLASFAKAWDAYTIGPEGTRPATKREIRTLRAMLEASLWTDGPQQDLGAVVEEHRASQVDRALREEHESETRQRAPRERPAWAWVKALVRDGGGDAVLDPEFKPGRESEEPSEPEKAGV